MTLKIRSRSPKSDQLFNSSQQCIYANLGKIHQLVQKIMHINESGRQQFYTFQSAPLTLKITSRSPKSNQLFPSSQQCIDASLVKIRQLVQKIMHGCTQKKADTDGIHTKNNISPHPLGWGDINIQDKLRKHISLAVCRQNFTNNPQIKFWQTAQ